MVLFLAADEDAALAGRPETAVGIDDLLDLHGDVAEHRVEVERLADQGEGGLADAVDVGDDRLRAGDREGQLIGAQVTLENSRLSMAVPVCVEKLSAGIAWTGRPSWLEIAASSNSLISARWAELLVDASTVPPGLVMRRSSRIAAGISGTW